MANHFGLKKLKVKKSSATMLAWNSNFLGLIHAPAWMENNAWGVMFGEERRTEQSGYFKKIINLFSCKWPE